MKYISAIHAHLHFIPLNIMYIQKDTRCSARNAKLLIPIVDLQHTAFFWSVGSVSPAQFSFVK